MEEMMDMMFAEMMVALGFQAWWETEGEWEGMEEVMILAGLPQEEVRDYFREMAYEL